MIIWQITVDAYTKCVKIKYEKSQFGKKNALPYVWSVLFVLQIIRTKYFVRLGLFISNLVSFILKKMLKDLWLSLGNVCNEVLYLMVSSWGDLVCRWRMKYCLEVVSTEDINWWIRTTEKKCYSDRGKMMRKMSWAALVFFFFWSFHVNFRRNSK